jgi:hypothetical protein
MRSSARYTGSDHQSASSSITALPLLSSSLDEESQRPLTSTGSPHTNADSIRASYGSEMHHDDVIEHLDVIGVWLHLYYYESALTLFFADSHVSTVSSLTNAANTILM